MQEKPMWKNDHLDKIQLDLLDKNILALRGTVDQEMVFYVQEALLRLVARQSPPVVMFVTSNGGDVEIGLDIYDALRSYSGEVIGVVYGYANSMAAVILQACKTRVCAPNAQVLVHHISKREVGLDVLRSRKKTEEVRKALEESQNKIYKILMQRTRRTLREIRRECAKNQAMSAEEALAFGLVDRVEDFMIDSEPDTTSPCPA